MFDRRRCFLVEDDCEKWLLGYVFHIIKHATKTDKDVFTTLLRTEKYIRQWGINYIWQIFWHFGFEIEVLVYAKKSKKKRLGNKFSFWRSNDNSSHIYKCIFVVMTFIRADHWNSFKIHEAKKSNDLEVSALPTEDVKVDELARHVYYTAKSIRWLTLLKVKSPVPWPPTGSFINEQSVTIPNFVV
jgi:hypothetical protein